MIEREGLGTFKNNNIDVIVLVIIAKTSLM